MNLLHCMSIQVVHQLGRQVAQSVEHAPHIQRLCPRRSRHRFDSTCGPLLHVIPLLSPLFPVYSSAVLKIKAQKAPKNILKKIKIKRVAFLSMIFTFCVKIISSKVTSVVKAYEHVP